ncbi:MAG: cyanophycin synthetase [Pirellulales bacterium]|nr:cyanophycin synthetase [Pirellulales bacterium]
MEFRKVQALRGPNIWANFPVIEAWIDLGDLKDSPSNEIPGFNDRLMNWLPTMIEHRCSIGERGGFFERLRMGTYPAHILEHITLELQSLAGTPVGFGKARESSEEGVYRVVFQYVEEALGRECLKVARELFLAAVHDRPFDLAGEIARLRNLAQEVCLGPSTGAIVAAAKARGIPVRRMNEYSLVQFGYGRKQRRIQAAETDRTSAIAEGLAQDKELTRKLLRSIGVPAPEGRPVAGADDAWAAACEIGLPVVVKPQDGNQGRGVATNLSTREQVVKAFEAAKKESNYVLVEKFAPGHDYRVLVIGGNVVAAARREPAHVVGDGQRTVRQLMDIVNADPRRGEHHATVLSKLKLDDISLAVLSEQDFAPDSVPPAGTTVLIRRNANLSTGGTAIDVTEYVHPEVAARAVEAAQVIGLDIAGVDVVAQDISRPLEEQRGVIVEVNAAPGLRMHLEPSAGVSRPVGEAIVEMMFTQDEEARIPIVAVTGVNGKTTTTRFIGHILKGVYRTVGMTCTDGIFIGERRIDTGDCSGPKSAAAVLMNPNVDAAVFETARGGVLREGLAFDRCNVAVVTNIGDGDHLGINDIHTTEDLAKVKRCIVDVVSPQGYAVLNAADPLVVEMAPHCPGGVLFFALDGSHPVIERHRNAGGRAAFVRDGQIILAEGPREESLMPVAEVPLTLCGMIGFHVENALSSIAAAWCLGVPPSAIRERAATIAADVGKVPARFNILEIEGAKVIVDYGHNVHALTAVIGVLDKFPHARRTVVYTTAGDRRDCDMLAQGKILGAAFDRVILYEDHYLRGRPQGEIISLIRQGVENGGRAKEIFELFSAPDAAEFAMNGLQPGDLLLLQADTVDETVDWIKHFVARLAEKKPSVEAEIEPVLEAEPLPAPQETPGSAKIAPPVLANAATVVKDY